MPIKIEVIPHDPTWRDQFQQESEYIKQALGDIVTTIHHIGSTSIPNIYAKPVIDMLVEVTDITQVDQREAAMIALGYEAMGEMGLPGRRYFRKENEQGIRTHHAHTYQQGTSEVKRHLAFRDYMIAHPEAAQAYSELKRELAKKLDIYDIEGYMDGKDVFIKEMEQRAIAWSKL